MHDEKIRKKVAMAYFVATISMLFQKDEKKHTAAPKSTPNRYSNQAHNGFKSDTCIRKLQCHSIPTNNSQFSSSAICKSNYSQTNGNNR